MKNIFYSCTLELELSTNEIFFQGASDAAFALMILLEKMERRREKTYFLRHSHVRVCVCDVHFLLPNLLNLTYITVQ